jgi:hypothetical protein
MWMELLTLTNFSESLYLISHALVTSTSHRLHQKFISTHYQKQARFMIFDVK